MENETVNINIRRGNFLSLVEVEAYIRDTIERYQGVNVGFIANYSSISYHRGFWTAEITLTSQDPNSVQVANTEPDFGF